MNKGIIIGVILIIAIAIGGAAYWTISNQQNQGENIKVDETAKSQSIRELIAMTTPQRCTFTETNESGNNEGVVYIGNNKMRGDFTSTTNGQVTKSHMITDNNKINIWLDGQTQGFVMDLNQTGVPQAASGQENFDINKKIEPDCEPWQIDESKFQLPTNVTFTSFEEIIENAMPTIEEGTTPEVDVTAEAENTTPTNNADPKCAACDQAPVETREQCRQLFGCQ